MHQEIWATKKPKKEFNVVLKCATHACTHTTQTQNVPCLYLCAHTSDDYYWGEGMFKFVVIVWMCDLWLHIIFCLWAPYKKKFLPVLHRNR